MKRINLSDGMPSSIITNDLKLESQDLLNKIKKECVSSGLSYVEINKALHLADEELYKSVINSSCPKSSNQSFSVELSADVLGKTITPLSRNSLRTSNNNNSE